VIIFYTDTTCSYFSDSPCKLRQTLSADIVCSCVRGAGNDGWQGQRADISRM